MHHMKKNAIKTIKHGMQLLIVAAWALFGCGGDDPKPTESERVTQLLTAGSGTWTPPSTGGITVDGVDVTEELFPAFSITFSNETFSTTGSSPVWLRQDTWTFKDNAAKIIIRGQDQREITLTEISESQLKLTLEWPATTTSGGRAGSLKGKHEFLLTK